VNDGFKDLDISFKIDTNNKKLERLIPQQESLLSLLSTLFFRIKHAVIMQTIAKKKPKKIVVSIGVSSKESTFSLDPSKDVLFINLNSENMEESCDLPDLAEGINQLNKINEISALSFFSKCCVIDFR